MKRIVDGYIIIVLKIYGIFHLFAIHKSFINAILNFLITAFVLFAIVKVINKSRENAANAKKLTREQKAELKANGVNRRDKAAVEAYFA